MSMTSPHAGQMKHRLRFERRGTVTNVGGVPTGAWATITGAESRSASVEPTLGGEEIIAGRIAGKTKYDIWLRSDTVTRALTNADRAVNLRTGEIYNLGQPIDPTGHRQWLMIQGTSAGNADGQG